MIVLAVMDFIVIISNLVFKTPVTVALVASWSPSTTTLIMRWHLLLLLEQKVDELVQLQIPYS